MSSQLICLQGRQCLNLSEKEKAPLSISRVSFQVDQIIEIMPKQSKLFNLGYVL